MGDSRGGGRREKKGRSVVKLNKKVVYGVLPRVGTFFAFLGQSSSPYLIFVKNMQFFLSVIDIIWHPLEHLPTFCLLLKWGLLADFDFTTCYQKKWEDMLNYLHTYYIILIYILNLVSTRCCNTKSRFFVFLTH